MTEPKYYTPSFRVLLPVKCQPKMHSSMKKLHHNLTTINLSLSADPLKSGEENNNFVTNSGRLLPMPAVKLHAITIATVAAVISIPLCSCENWFTYM